MDNAWDAAPPVCQQKSEFCIRPLDGEGAYVSTPIKFAELCERFQTHAFTYIWHGVTIRIADQGGVDKVFSLPMKGRFRKDNR